LVTERLNALVGWVTVTPRKTRSETEVGLDQLVEQLTGEELREVVAWAADWHEDVERRVRLTAARSSGDLRVLRAEADPVRYRAALGEAGLVEFRSLLAAQGDQDGFAARYARERLAVLDGDSAAIVALLGGDLSRPHQFIRVAEAMVELSRDEEAVVWARRGIEQTTGWQTNRLYDIACAAYARRGERAEGLALRRAQHERTPSSSSYRQLRTAAEAIHAWPVDRDAARRVLSDRNPPALVDALLDDGEDELAWQTAMALPDTDLGDHAWLRLAETRQKTHPAQALPVYWRLIDSTLQTADRRAYTAAVGLLTRARDAAKAGDEIDDFEARLAALREHHRRRPTLIAMLNKARLAPVPPGP
jgi:uncharacterized Zn finger protein